MLRPLVLLLKLLSLRQPLKGLARSQNVEYLDALGSVLAEMGQQEDAITVLRRAVNLQPERGFSKYMYVFIYLFIYPEVLLMHQHVWSFTCRQRERPSLLVAMQVPWTAAGWRRSPGCAAEGSFSAAVHHRQPGTCSQRPHM